jgi:hypothetical protein
LPTKRRIEMPGRLLRKSETIFADVMIVLISLRHTVAYPVVFRYFGFAVATVMIRLALTAPRVVNAGLGVAATVFAIALTWLYNRTSAVQPADSV